MFKLSALTFRNNQYDNCPLQDGTKHFNYILLTDVRISSNQNQL